MRQNRLIASPSVRGLLALGLLAWLSQPTYAKTPQQIEKDRAEDAAIQQKINQGLMDAQKEHETYEPIEMGTIAVCTPVGFRWFEGPAYRINSHSDKNCICEDGYVKSADKLSCAKTPETLAKEKQTAAPLLKQKYNADFHAYQSLLGCYNDLTAAVPADKLDGFKLELTDVGAGGPKGPVLVTPIAPGDPKGPKPAIYIATGRGALRVGRPLKTDPKYSKCQGKFVYRLDQHLSNESKKLWQQNYFDIDFESGEVKATDQKNTVPAECRIVIDDNLYSNWDSHDQVVMQSQLSNALGRIQKMPQLTDQFCKSPKTSCRAVLKREGFGEFFSKKCEKPVIGGGPSGATDSGSGAAK